MIEIGETLGEARRRQGLKLEDAARATRIPTRYLRALEDERFAALPAPFYVRACLREYADFLGLDGDRLVEEYRDRFPEAEQSPMFELIAPKRPARLWWRAAGVLVAAAAATALVVMAFRPSGEAKPQGAAAPPTRPTTSMKRPTPPPTQAPAVPRIVISAARGDCWLLVRAGGLDGRILYEGMLRRGDAVRLRKPRLWVRLGAPWNVDVRLDGSALGGELAEGSKPRNVLISRAGIRDA